MIIPFLILTTYYLNMYNKYKHICFYKAKLVYLDSEFFCKMRLYEDIYIQNTRLKE